jgi:hypothetical protein
LGAFKIGAWSRSFLASVSVHNSLSDSLSWIFIYFSGEWSCLWLWLIRIGRRDVFLDFEDIVNIVLFVFWPVGIGLRDVLLVVVAFGHHVFEILPLVVAVGDIVHLLDRNQSLALL